MNTEILKKLDEQSKLIRELIEKLEQKPDLKNHALEFFNYTQNINLTHAISPNQLYDGFIKSKNGGRNTF